MKAGNRVYGSNDGVRMVPHVKFSAVWKSGTNEITGYVPWLVVPNKSRDGFMTVGSAMAGVTMENAYPTMQEAIDAWEKGEPKDMPPVINNEIRSKSDRDLIQEEGLYRG